MTEYYQNPDKIFTLDIDKIDSDILIPACIGFGLKKPDLVKLSNLIKKIDLSEFELFDICGILPELDEYFHVYNENTLWKYREVKRFEEIDYEKRLSDDFVKRALENGYWDVICCDFNYSVMYAFIGSKIDNDEFIDEFSFYIDLCCVDPQIVFDELKNRYKEFPRIIEIISRYNF